MRSRVLTAVICLAAGGFGAPASAAGTTHDVTLVVERTASATVDAQFRLDLTALPAEGEEGFIGVLGAKLDRNQRAVRVEPGLMAPLNEHRAPTAYSMGSEVGSCTVGLCALLYEFGGLTVTGNDPSIPLTVVTLRARTIRWTFEGTGYRIRRTASHFRYVTGADSGASGTDGGVAAEAYLQETSMQGGGRGSLAQGAAPCSTTRMGVASRGVGTVTLSGGGKQVQATCPRDSGVIAQSARSRTTWRLAGQVIGDSTQRGARLLVIDLPL